MDAPKLYDFQKQAIDELLNGKHVAVLQTGAGKGAIALNWAQAIQGRTGKTKLLIVTTPSKRDSGDFEEEMKLFTPSLYSSLSSLSVVSWHGLDKWYRQNFQNMCEYIYIFDEIAKAKAGISSQMGRAFLRITSQTKDWAGFTATPGDRWIDFYAYFQATGKTNTKTQFMHDYCIIQTYKGFPEIVNYKHQDELKRFWGEISTAPDTSQMTRELPPEIHKTINFKATPDYYKTLKTRLNKDGEMLDTAGALTAELRRQCFTKSKRQWLSDFIEGLGTNAVLFYNFTRTGDELQEIVRKALPKGARIWRIDGSTHEIPTKDTIGKYDIVLCQWQAGSEALNLQFLHYWVGIEMTYSYSTAIQARGRIKRLGQENTMHYYYLKTDKTIESAVYEALRTKSDFAADNWLIAQGITNLKED